MFAHLPSPGLGKGPGAVEPVDDDEEADAHQVDRRQEDEDANKDVEGDQAAVGALSVVGDLLFRRVIFQDIGGPANVTAEEVFGPLVVGAPHVQAVPVDVLLGSLAVARSDEMLRASML